MEQMKVGIIGAGRIAENMAKTLDGMDDAAAYAIAARHLDRAQKFAKEWGFEKAYGSYEVVCFYLVLRMNFFSVQNELSASNAVDTCQHVGQSGFTRTVFSDQRVNLSFVYIEGYILNCFCNTEVFTKIFYL